MDTHKINITLMPAVFSGFNQTEHDFADSDETLRKLGVDPDEVSYEDYHDHIDFHSYRSDYARNFVKRLELEILEHVPGFKSFVFKEVTYPVDYMVRNNEIVVEMHVEPDMYFEHLSVTAYRDTAKYDEFIENHYLMSHIHDAFFKTKYLTHEQGMRLDYILHLLIEEGKLDLEDITERVQEETELCYKPGFDPETLRGTECPENSH